MKTIFTKKLIDWQKQYGRHGLPWQGNNPYYIWLSEIMLQQTQVITVLDYFPRFIQKFPTVKVLASASEDEVLALWSGLGYYSRARNLHFAAQQIINEFDGIFPQDRHLLEGLKGVGRSTAAAISAFAFSQKETILDGNVKRVLCRFFALDGVMNARFERDLWTKAESLVPDEAHHMSAYTQGLMDLGAIVCTRSRPQCDKCPMDTHCMAKKEDRIAELPRKKTPVKVRQLDITWAIIENQTGDVFLEKRPEKGIWGGLMCVPSFESWHEMQDFCQNHHLDLDAADVSDCFTHKLTHRHLVITPYRFKLDSVGAFHPLFNKGLMKKDQVLQSGIPKPLREFLVNSI